MSTSWHAHSASRRRHRARQIRANIVQLAREYRSVFGDWEAARDDAAVGGWEEQQHEDHCFDLLDLAQRALFCALEELDMLEEDVSDRTTAATPPR